MRNATTLTLLALTAWTSSLCSVDRAYADGMRCGSRLVSDGDTTYDVRERCGEPTQATRRVEQRVLRDYVAGPCVGAGAQLQCGRVIERVVDVVVEEWLYDFGPQQFIHYLTFEQSRLQRVNTGGYGHKRE